MLQWLLNLDKQVFYLIHETLRNHLFDICMPFITDAYNWKWFFIAAWSALFILGGHKGRLACITVLIAVLFADNFVSYILKPLFNRIRPNVALTGTYVIDIAKGRIPSPSFPSGHATNIFVLAIVLSYYYRKLWSLWFLCAITVAYSRVYVGVHYPLDVLGGAFIGALSAVLFIWCIQWIDSKIKRRQKCSE